MSVDNRVVVQIINNSLARQFRQHHGESVVTLVQYALDDLMERRNDPHNPRASLDENLAAAEHYMVARWAVGISAYSRSQMVAMVMAYEGCKMLVDLLPDGSPWGSGRALEFLMRHNPERPTAPSSPALTGWGIAGAFAGEADRTAVRGRQPPVVALPPAFAPIVGG